MSKPRWLNDVVVDLLKDSDNNYAINRVTGPIRFEVHYQHGNPRVFKLLGPAPVLFSSSVATTS